MTDWQPTASKDALELRACLLSQIREFFAERNVLEVETPLLAHAPVTDPYLAAFSCRYSGPASPEGMDLYLQTSPEYAMKRLLAADSGPIFQICKAFRDGEAGRMHNPEFTMLEWYRPGFDHYRLMDEINDLIAMTLGRPPAARHSYAEIFAEKLGVNPHSASLEELQTVAEISGLSLTDRSDEGLDRDGWLNLLFSHLIEPKLGFDQPAFVFDYPATQAALARIRGEDPPVAERFELFIDGLELANGYHELCDAKENRRRFLTDLEKRKENGLPQVPIDDRLLAALEAGIEPCAGVALGFDRLVMVAAGTREISNVLAFPVNNA